jgi:anti-sigma B factor antagonist
MKHQVEKLGPITLLTVLESHLDGSNAGEFKAIVAELQETSPRLVLDLSQVEFLDSSGCGAVLTASRWLDRVGGRIKIAGLTKQGRNTFEIFQMLRIFEVYPTREDAVRAFHAAPERP